MALVVGREKTWSSISLLLYLCIGKALGAGERLGSCREDGHETVMGCLLLQLPTSAQEATRSQPQETAGPSQVKVAKSTRPLYDSGEACEVVSQVGLVSGGWDLNGDNYVTTTECFNALAQNGDSFPLVLARPFCRHAIYTALCTRPLGIFKTLQY